MNLRFTLHMLAFAAPLGAGLAIQPSDAFAETRLNFVSCPIVRDTATVPCWLTEHDGELYYMGIQTDVSAEFHPPYLGHKVLVEAVVSDKPPICGGVVLEPIKISVMPELDGSCNTMLPAEDRYTIDFNPRPPGPSGGRLAFARPPADEPLRPPYEAREFELTFDFDRSISFNHARPMSRIADYAKDIGASRIEVEGRRGATLLSDGSLLVESAGIAKRRAEEVAELLGGLGLDADIALDFSSEPVPADGIEDWRSRSVRVRVVP
jgi:hypothetical protein